MAIIEINKDPSKKELYWFGGLLAAFAVVAGGMASWRFGAPTVGLWITGVGVGLSLLFFAVPPIRRYLYLGWMYAAFPIGATLSLLILAITYYGVMTPTGLLLRLFGKDPMQRRLDPSAQTYWIERTSKDDKSRYFRQS